MKQKILTTVEPQNTSGSGHFVRFSETFRLWKLWKSEGQNDEHFPDVPVKVCAQYRMIYIYLHILFILSKNIFIPYLKYFISCYNADITYLSFDETVLDEMLCTQNLHVQAPFS